MKAEDGPEIVARLVRETVTIGRRRAFLQVLAGRALVELIEAVRFQEFLWL